MEIGSLHALHYFIFFTIKHYNQSTSDRMQNKILSRVQDLFAEIGNIILNLRILCNN